MIKLNAKELRTVPVDEKEAHKIPKNDIYLILDNVLDTYNVGSIFRLADAVSIQKIYLCGETLTPPNSKIKKASINTWGWVDWEYSKSAFDAVSNLKTQIPKLQTYVVEQDNRSVPFYSVKFEFPIALVVGNETYGCSEEVKKAADQIVELPLWGVNKSLNVMVCTGIVLYEIMRQTKNL
jgi:tRNA G18 (ribose-2'-O)-methylase SpoU